MTKLRDIADIRSGLTFRTRAEPNPAGGYRLLQIKDITGDGALRLDNLMLTDVSGHPSDSVLRQGDVLLTARGTRNQAALFDVPFDNIIVGSQFFIIRLRSQVVLPAFLAWHLNQHESQRYLRENTSGSYIPFLPKGPLAELPVPFPSLTVQRSIVEIHRLSVQENHLAQTIQEKRNQLTALALHRALAADLKHSVSP